MGADLWVNDKGNRDHKYWMRKDTAYLARALTMPWFQEGRDGKGYGDNLGYWTPQDLVHRSSFQAADEELPWILDKAIEWLRRRVPDYYDEFELRYDITQERFDDARDFIHRCAIENLDAEWCPS